MQHDVTGEDCPFCPLEGGKGKLVRSHIDVDRDGRKMYLYGCDNIMCASFVRPEKRWKGKWVGD